MYQITGKMIVYISRLLYLGSDGNIQLPKRKGKKTMKTIYYLNDKKTTRKALKEQLGEDRLKRMTAKAEEGFRADPLEQQSFFLGSRGILTIEFA